MTDESHLRRLMWAEAERTLGIHPHDWEEWRQWQVQYVLNLRTRLRRAEAQARRYRADLMALQAAHPAAQWRRATPLPKQHHLAEGGEEG